MARALMAAGQLWRAAEMLAYAYFSYMVAAAVGVVIFLSIESFLSEKIEQSGISFVFLINFIFITEVIFFDFLDMYQDCFVSYDKVFQNISA